MKVEIEMIPKMTTQLDTARAVKDIAKDLMETCQRCGVEELTYKHDYFKIRITDSIVVKQSFVPIDNILEKYQGDANETDSDR